MLTRSLVRHLGESERADVERFLAQDPIAAAQVVERVAARGLAWWRTDGRMYGYGSRHDLQALCWSGAHVTPIGGDRAASASFAEVLGRSGRGCGSIVGPSAAVLDLWAELGPAWGPARDIRPHQPLMVTEQPASIAADPEVHQLTLHELDLLMPAAIAMYAEEVGVPPLNPYSNSGYRGRMAALIRGGRAYGRVHDGQVIFKADVGVLTQHTAQIQGVWVHPLWRGRGIATAGMAAVLADVLRRFAPTASLYVNDYNLAARQVYARCGFRQVGEFATVLF